MKKRKPALQKILVDAGVEIDLPRAYDVLEKKSIETVEGILKDYPKARQMWELLVFDPEVRADWDMADYIAVTKLNFNDHGEIHAKIAAASSLSMLDLLRKAEKKSDVISSGAGDWDDAFLVVTCAALLHDIGNQVHRVSHGDISPYLAVPILDRLLPLIYSEIEKKTEIRGFILHAINTHDAEPPPLTVEAALVCISDACDLTKGRGRLAFDLGNINIHTVSALSIDSVAILPGEQKPIKIIVTMNNSAGIFQVEEALASKINAGPLSDSVEMVATTYPRKAKTDKRIIFEIEMKGRKFEPRGVKKGGEKES